MKVLKNITVLLFLIFINSEIISAQENRPVSNYFGANAGYSMSRINTTIINGLNFMSGYHAGLVYQNFNNKNFGSQIEINYSERGGTDRFEKKYLTDTLGIPDEIDFNLKLSYIELDWMTVLQIGKNKNKLNILLGPNVSYLLSQKITFIETRLESGYPDKINRNFDLGANIGFNYARILNSGKIDIEIRYTHGFYSLYESTSINNSIVNQNQVLTLKVAYLFKIGK